MLQTTNVANTIKVWGHETPAPKLCFFNTGNYGNCFIAGDFVVSKREYPVAMVFTATNMPVIRYDTIR